MTKSEAFSRVRKAGGSPRKFWMWVQRQTMGLNPDGSLDIYSYDVERFIRGITK